MKEKAITGLSASCVLLAGGVLLVAATATAGTLDNVIWCEQHPEAPARAAAYLAMAPDGQKRMQRSAAELIKRAREAANACRDDEAIEWVALCQWHNPGAQKDVRENRVAVLGYLRAEGIHCP
jgi:hypothetical protein